MTEVRVAVDQLRLEYKGPFDAQALYRLLTSYWKEKGFDFHPYKEFEHDTNKGKQIEWEMKPWKQVSHETRDLVNIRVLISNYKKVDVEYEGKKRKMGFGEVLIYFNGYVDIDQWNVWERRPFFQFLRTIYTHFIFKVYTERFEQRFNFDFHQLYQKVEELFNMYRHYRVVSKVPPYAGMQA